MPLRAVATLKTGHTPSRLVLAYWEECYIPWVTLTDVSALRTETSDTINDTNERISDLGLANSAAELLPTSTVILSRTASVGFSAILGAPMATTQDFVNWICGPKIIPRYLLRVFRAMKPEFRRLTNGSVHQTIYMPDAAAFRIPLPPVAEQSAIADFLDRETALADALVAKYQRLITLLEEKRIALITQAVTKGLDSCVPMKDSGVEWIGQIPSHWDAFPIRRIAEVQGGAAITEELLTSDVSGIPFYKVGDIESADGNGVLGDARVSIKPSLVSKAHVKTFRPGTIILAKRGAALLLNRFRVTERDACLDSNLMAITFDNAKTVLTFILYTLSTVDFSRSVKPGAIPSIDAPEIKNEVIALPPYPEQMKIAKHLGKVTSDILRTIVLAEQALVLTRERRAALITAAVTGQIGVEAYRSKKQQPITVSA